MSGSMSDQAAGLRQWASLQRREQEEAAEATSAADDAALPAVDETPPAATPARPKTVLLVVGLPGRGPRQVERVKARLGQWSALGRRWAGTPDDWDVRIVMPDDPELPRLAREHARWALWVDSNADTFAQTYRLLRQLAERRGPRRLLALHETHLPRAGLLRNLQDAAHSFVGIELLILAH